jgi:hypothetical protein
LDIIEMACFSHCDALHAIDLGATQAKSFDHFVFAGCGVRQVSIPASLREMGWDAFGHTPLKMLDLSACAGIKVGGG